MPMMNRAHSFPTIMMAPKARIAVASATHESATDSISATILAPSVSNSPMIAASGTSSFVVK